MILVPLVKRNHNNTIFGAIAEFITQFPETLVGILFDLRLSFFQPYEDFFLGFNFRGELAVGIFFQICQAFCFSTIFGCVLTIDLGLLGNDGGFMCAVGEVLKIGIAIPRVV